MKKKAYQRPAVRIIPLTTSEVVMAFSYDTGDFFSRKKEADWEEEDETPNRFGYWD